MSSTDVLSDAGEQAQRDGLDDNVEPEAEGPRELDNETPSHNLSRAMQQMREPVSSN